MFSGAGQAWCYKEIGEAEFPDVYVILGVNHSSQETCSDNEDWETPLGIVECDRELAKKMQDNGLTINNFPHKYEHSIEVQLPFLQYVSKDNEKKLRILPIMIADDEYKKWTDIIEKSLAELKRKAVIICSSDFTHYGSSYGYKPFTDAKKNLKPFDMEAVEKIIAKDVTGFIKFCEDNHATICGRHGINVMIKMAADAKAKGELLNYYTSADILDDYSNAVGYASIVFR
jgi:AmmeMemoRadiSam system protein B